MLYTDPLQFSSVRFCTSAMKNITGLTFTLSHSSLSAHRRKGGDDGRKKEDEGRKRQKRRIVGEERTDGMEMKGGQTDRKE